MRRRNHRHVYMAASVLMRRFVETDDRRRAIFYGEVARTAAAALDDPFARATVLNYLGITFVADSQLEPAVEAFEEALRALDKMPQSNELVQSFASGITANLGGTKILTNDIDEGIHLIETVITELDDATERAEACLDLALGYTENEDYETAEDLAREGLSLASTRRQIRNANHLLGEICLRTGRDDEADVYFDVVAGFYPEYANIKRHLTGTRICSVVNWKA
jgi:tetratricopeptide (TPR) repeat protein